MRSGALGGNESAGITGWGSVSCCALEDMEIIKHNNKRKWATTLMFSVKRLFMRAILGHFALNASLLKAFNHFLYLLTALSIAANNCHTVS
jgi:hypothetical protein